MRDNQHWAQDRAAARRKERDKYDAFYFQEIHWCEDFPRGDYDHSRRFAFMADAILRFFRRPTKIVDVGCGAGQLVRNFLARGYHCAGTEVSQWALEVPLRDLVDRGLVVECGADQMPFQDDDVDLVICTDVLEHVLDFDAEASVHEIIRIGCGDFFITINLDHVYEYHPTIRPREWWEALFAAAGAHQRLDLQDALRQHFAREYPEYEFFIYQKYP